MIIAIGLLSLFSYYTHDELEQRRKLQAFKEQYEVQIQNFKDDCDYMISEWEKVNNDPNYIFAFDTSKLAYETNATNFSDYFYITYTYEGVFRHRFKSNNDLEIELYVSPTNNLEYNESGNIKYESLRVYIYNFPTANNEENFLKSKESINLLNDCVDRIIASPPNTMVLMNNMARNISMLVVLCITIILNVITIVLCLARKQDNKKLETNNLAVNMPNSEIKEDNQEQISWEELKDKEVKDCCYRYAIGALYIVQLEDKDNKWNLTKQEKALKKYSLDNLDFDMDELNEDERKEVEYIAKMYYEDTYSKQNMKLSHASKEEQAEIEKEYNSTKKKYITHKIINWCLVGLAIVIGFIFSLQNSPIVALALLPIIIVFITSAWFELKKIKYLIAKYKYYNNCPNAPQLDENKTPAKHKKIESIVCFSISGVFAIVCLVLIIILSDSAFTCFSGLMALGFGVYGSMCKYSIGTCYCKKCGHEGIVINDDVLSSHNEIERKFTSYPTTVTDGHVSYDNKGNAYVEKIKTYEEHKKTYKCSICGETWTNISTETK